MRACSGPVAVQMQPQGVVRVAVGLEGVSNKVARFEVIGGLLANTVIVIKITHVIGVQVLALAGRRWSPEAEEVRVLTHTVPLVVDAIAVVFNDLVGALLAKGEFVPLAWRMAVQDGRARTVGGKPPSARMYEFTRVKTDLHGLCGVVATTVGHRGKRVQGNSRAVVPHLGSKILKLQIQRKHFPTQSKFIGGYTVVRCVVQWQEDSSGVRVLGTRPIRPTGNVCT